MSQFRQGGSSKFQEYMIEMISKIHDIEEMLLSGDDRHLEELKQVAQMIEQYVEEGQGQKFEPSPYRNIQGGQGQGTSNFYPEYPMYERGGGGRGGSGGGGGTRSHIGYIPYPYYYPIFNEQGGSSDGRDERRGSRSAFNQGGGSGGGQGGSGGGSGSGGSQGYSSEYSNRRGR